MDSIGRYRCDPNSVMLCADSGEWVLYDDVEALQSRLGEVEAERDMLQETCNRLRDSQAQYADGLRNVVEQLTLARQSLADEKAIVDRIWDIFGRPSYESLNGKSLYDLIIGVIEERDLARQELAGAYEKAAQVCEDLTLPIGVSSERNACASYIRALKPTKEKPVTDNELLPCPFCGYESEHSPIRLQEKHSGNIWFHCATCGACSGSHKMEANAIEAWNSRAELLSPARGDGEIARVIEFCRHEACKPDCANPAILDHIANWLSDATPTPPIAEGENAVGLSVICRECGTLVSGVEAGDRVRWVTCQKCAAPVSTETHIERVRMVEALRTIQRLAGLRNDTSPNATYKAIEALAREATNESNGQSK